MLGAQEKQRSADLSLRLEDPANTDRFRQLKGKDLSQVGGAAALRVGAAGWAAR